jgi:hypothetical protein
MVLLSHKLGLIPLKETKLAKKSIGQWVAVRLERCSYQPRGLRVEAATFPTTS